MNKKAVVFGVLVLILVGVWLFVLREPGQKATSSIKEEEKIAEIDLGKEIPELLEKVSREDFPSPRPLAKRDPLQPIFYKESILKEEDIEGTLSFVLSGIIYDKKPIAIINEKIVKEGGEIGGLKVLKIEPGRVLLKRGEGNFWLTFLLEN